MPLEELHRALVLLSTLARVERPEVPPLAAFGIFLPRIQAIPAVLELSNHSRLLARCHCLTQRLIGSSAKMTPTNARARHDAANAERAAEVIVEVRQSPAVGARAVLRSYRSTQ